MENLFIINKMRNILKAVRFIQKMNPIEREATVFELEEIHRLLKRVDKLYFSGANRGSGDIWKAQHKYQNRALDFLEHLSKQMHSKGVLYFTDWFKLYHIFVECENEDEVLG